MIFWSNIAKLHENSGISIIKSVANLKISWSFFIRKILRSTRTLDCDKYRLKSKGKFFSFCWAIFLYFSTPISWVMSYDKKCPRFVDPVRGWVNISYQIMVHLQYMYSTRLYHICSISVNPFHNPSINNSKTVHFVISSTFSLLCVNVNVFEFNEFHQ